MTHKISIETLNDLRNMAIFAVTIHLRKLNKLYVKCEDEEILIDLLELEDYIISREEFIYGSLNVIYTHKNVDFLNINITRYLIGKMSSTGIMVYLDEKELDKWIEKMYT